MGIILALPGFLLAITAYGFGMVIGFGPVSTLLVTLGAIVGALGLLSFTIGVAIYVFGPIGDPARAASTYASYRTILGCLYIAVVVANLVAALYFLGPYLVDLLLPGSASAPNSLAGLGSRVRAPDSLIVSLLAQELAILGVLYLRIIRPGIITWRDMGLDGEALPLRIALGVVVAVALVAAMEGAALLLRLFGIEQTQEAIFAPIREASLPQFVITLLAASLLTGFVEEAFFRGYAFRSLFLTRGPRHAYLASALIFAGAHVNLQALLPLFAGGLILAYSFRRTGSILPAVVAHAINNGLALAIIYSGMA